jgi:hypothetical protein
MNSVTMIEPAVKFSRKQFDEQPSPGKEVETEENEHAYRKKAQSIKAGVILQDGEWGNGQKDNWLHPNQGLPKEACIEQEGNKDDRSLHLERIAEAPVLGIDALEANGKYGAHEKGRSQKEA